MLNKKLLSKMFSSLTALGILVSSFFVAGSGTLVSAAGTAENLFQNGGFEDDLNGWSFNGTSGSSVFTEVVSPGHNSDKALSVYTTVQYRGIGQSFKLKPNTPYHLSLWIKADEASKDGDIWNALKVWNSSKTFVDGAAVANKAKGWQKCYYDFTTDVSGIININFNSINTGEDCKVIIDDFRLSEIKSDGIILNGDFELDTAGWKKAKDGSKYSAVENGYNGSETALRLVSEDQTTDMGIKQAVTLKPNTKYIASAYYRLADDSSKDDVYLQFKITSISQNGTDHVKSKEWTYKSFEFETGDTVEENTYIQILNAWNQPGIVLIDDVRVDEIVEDSAGTVVENGGFENQYIGWENLAKFPLVNGGANGSKYCYEFKKCTQWSTALKQTITVEPNTTYQISVMTKLPEGAEGKANRALFVRTTDNTVNLCQQSLEAGSSDMWSRNETQFNSGDNTSAVIHLIYNPVNTTPEDSLLVDDIVITKVEYITEKVDGNIYIKSTTLTGELTVPKYICGQKVYGISAGAFTGGNITRLEIPYGITLADGAVSDGTVILANPYSDAVRYAKENNITYIYNCGDVNGNGTTDIVDIVRIKRYLSGSTTEIDSFQADIDPRDEKGVIDDADLAALRIILLEGTHLG